VKKLKRVRKLLVNCLQRVKISLSFLYTRAMVRHKDVSNTKGEFLGTEIASIIQIVAQTDVMDAKSFPTALLRRRTLSQRRSFAICY